MKEKVSEAILRDLGTLRRLYLHYREGNPDDAVEFALGRAIERLEERAEYLRKEGR